MQSILVTGCAGFIGWKVCELLLADGFTVLGLDNLNDAYDVRLKRWRLAQLEGRTGFSFHRLDVTDRDGLRHLVRRWHEQNRDQPPLMAVINLAARAGVRQSVADPWVYYETNVTGTLNLLELCREWEIKKFVLASTSSLYGAHNLRPFREDADTNGPLSPYAASKKAAEVLCYTYHYLFNLDVTVFRYFTVYGPAGRPDMSLFRFVQWITEGRPVIVFGDGQQSRDFTHVEDIARGTIAGLRPLGYEVINLGSDSPIVLNDVIRLVEELIGKKGTLDRQPPHPADVLATWADITKANEMLQWRPQVDFSEGVAHFVSWYQQHRDWARDIQTV